MVLREIEDEQIMNDADCRPREGNRTIEEVRRAWSKAIQGWNANGCSAILMGRNL